MARSYNDAIRLLRSRSKDWLRLHHPEQIKDSKANLIGMGNWLSQLGYDDSKSFDMIHVTGTKGKGSTCAATECLVRVHFRARATPFKTGLYTSPHLLSERERIRINFQPLSETAFARYFFEVWDRLRQEVQDDAEMPRYLQMLALLSVYVFWKEKVDLAVYEVHAGGRFDATNVFERPVACGFTEIGLDHVPLLGHSVPEIAWHKSGILKARRPAFSVEQQKDAQRVLIYESQQLDCSLSFIPIRSDLPRSEKLQLEAQKRNFSLAIALADHYLSLTNQRLNDEDIIKGIEQYTWPGRFQIIRDDPYHWYLDLAHNEMSIPVGLSWFDANLDPTDQEQSRVLIFGHESQRSTEDMIEAILQYCLHHNLRFHQVILTPYVQRVTGVTTYSRVVAQEHTDMWRVLPQEPLVTCADSVHHALDLARKACRQSAHILIFGSSHLISNALDQLPGGVSSIEG